ncbi:lipoyl amidotransferase LIPT1, mitochondrial isoform X2 [Culicoides brevitarsis]|uniref:lipoyl amidotransferase LIPT1, mitochondrial isoform X2 n=1 Tax=Culicoides brevitarsis TaxID=469753 RepID=UPI00307B2E25
MAAPIIVNSTCRTPRFAYILFKQATKSQPAALSAVRCANFSTEHFNSNKNIPKHTSKYIKSVPDKDIRKSIFISQSYNVFANLALEDWIYKNFDFAHHHVLMLWSNDPCVVIGRHQNPFAETNGTYLNSNGIEMARRNSGGGAVFHDRGNLNCTFFTPRERYNRTYNLNVITRALYREYNISADVSERDDITISGKKISGTAAKLGQPNAYHHCTLLVNSNKDHLRNALSKTDSEIQSKATPSVRSSIKNLADINKKINMPQLLSAIGYEYLRTPATELVDGGRELLEKQSGFHLINPTEKWFPGLNAIKETFSSWDWRYGKTPKFSVLKSVQMKSGNGDLDMKIKLDVEKGLIEDISLMIPNSEPIPVVSTLKGKPYTEDNLQGIIAALKDLSTLSNNINLG